ncbi:MAG: hypothetical protein ACOYBP_07690 [Microbacteriaceae bacterium]
MSLRFADAGVLNDLKVFLERAERAGASSVRLTVVAGRLLSSVPIVISESIITPGPTILGMRVSEVQSDADADKVVAIRSILERIAHLPADATGPIEWPPAELHEAWAGVSAPQSGWEPMLDIELDYLRRSAEATLAALDGTSSPDPHGLLAEALSVNDPNLGIPVGMAAAAQSLGFLIGDGEARFSRAGRWARLSTAYGHVLARV